jgi:hypothetical protein
MTIATELWSKDKNCSGGVGYNDSGDFICKCNTNKDCSFIGGKLEGCPCSKGDNWVWVLISVGIVLLVVLVYYSLKKYKGANKT